MTQRLDEQSPARQRLATVLTEVFAPVVLIVALLIAVAIHSTGEMARGLLLGLTAAAFVGVLPYLLLLFGIRRSQLGDRHLRLREQRPRMMAIGLVCAGLGLAAMVVLRVPRELLALVAAMVTGVAVALIISSFWKISIHAACAAGTVAVLTVVFGWTALALTPIVVAIGWARVALRDHTTAQVAAGAGVGAAVAAGVMALLA